MAFNDSSSILKPHITYQKQVDRLNKRGLIIYDNAKAITFLEECSYYRFTAYLLPFKDGDRYYPGTKFSTIQRIYEFDRRLRGLILSIFEPLEIILRTAISHYHTQKYGSGGYYSPDAFHRKDYHKKFKVDLARAIKGNQDHPIIRHHNKCYKGYLPLWAAMEFFSFGMLSRFYANMKKAEKVQVARTFRCGQLHLESWLYCLTDLRNRCAHYSRLYYTWFKSAPRSPKGAYKTNNHRLFDLLYVMSLLYVRQAGIWKSEFVQPLEALIETYEDDINTDHIGFPTDWQRLLG